MVGLQWYLVWGKRDWIDHGTSTKRLRNGAVLSSRKQNRVPRVFAKDVQAWSEVHRPGKLSVRSCKVSDMDNPGFFYRNVCVCSPGTSNKAGRYSGLPPHRLPGEADRYSHLPPPHHHHLHHHHHSPAPTGRRRSSAIRGRNAPTGWWTVHYSR